MNPALILWAIDAGRLLLKLRTDGSASELKDAVNNLIKELEPHLPAKPEGLTWDEHLADQRIELAALLSEIKARHGG